MMCEKEEKMYHEKQECPEYDEVNFKDVNFKNLFCKNPLILLSFKLSKSHDIANRINI